MGAVYDVHGTDGQSCRHPFSSSPLWSELDNPIYNCVTDFQRQYAFTPSKKDNHEHYGTSPLAVAATRSLHTGILGPRPASDEMELRRVTSLNCQPVNIAQRFEIHTPSSATRI